MVEILAVPGIHETQAFAFRKTAVSVLIDSLDMLLPQDIPTDSFIADWTLCHPVCAAILEKEIADREEITNSAMAEQLERVLAQIPPAGKTISDPDGQPDDLAHDAYFHVRRVEQEQAAVLVRSVLCARLVFLREVDEAPVTISNKELERIDRGFADFLSCLCGGCLNAAPYVTEWQSRGETYHAKRRWVRGHLVFASLTQGLILAFRSLGQGLRAGITEEVQRLADLSVSLLDASAGAFLFTGDFPPEEYESSIRPSMTPPASPVGLSGLMSADHRYLAQTMRDMRPALKSLAEQEPQRHERIAAALSGVYDSHIHVCERFVGPRPSILTAGRTERSGPSLIEQFKTLRLKPFEHAQRALRLAAERPKATLGECPFHK